MTWLKWSNINETDKLFLGSKRGLFTKDSSILLGIVHLH